MNLSDPDILDGGYQHFNFIYESPEMRSKTGSFMEEDYRGNREKERHLVLINIRFGVS